MRFQLISDLHLEFLKTIPKIVPRAEYLILAGDVGYPNRENFSEFMKDVTNKFKKVFYIPGNHEYYCTKDGELLKSDVDDLIDDLSSRIGFVNMNNRTHDLEGIRIIGSTLWTRTTAVTYPLLKWHMNDYNYITVRPKESVNPRETGVWHEESVAFLQKELANPDVKKLVVTHHLPSIKFIHPKYHGHPASCGFFTDLEHLFNDTILAWCGGHTHEPVNGNIGSTKIFVNPAGYPSETKVREPDWEFVFEI